MINAVLAIVRHGRCSMDLSNVQFAEDGGGGLLLGNTAPEQESD